MGASPAGAKTFIQRFFLAAEKNYSQLQINKLLLYFSG
jgi:hypothetical protein